MVDLEMFLTQLSKVNEYIQKLSVFNKNAIEFAKLKTLASNDLLIEESLIQELRIIANGFDRNNFNYYKKRLAEVTNLIIQSCKN